MAGDRTAIVAGGDVRNTPAAAHLASLALAGRASVASSLHRAARLATGSEHADGLAHPWHRRPPTTLAALRAGLADRYAVATANASVNAIRGALRAAWLSGDMDRAMLERSLAALRQVRGKAAPGRSLSPVEARKLFEAAGGDRNHAAGGREAVAEPVELLRVDRVDREPAGPCTGARWRKLPTGHPSRLRAGARWHWVRVGHSRPGRLPLLLDSFDLTRSVQEGYRVRGGTAPRQPLPGTREAWPQRVSWLSRLSCDRQPRPPQPRTLRLNAPHRPLGRTHAPRAPARPSGTPRPAAAHRSPAGWSANLLFERDARLRCGALKRSNRSHAENWERGEHAAMQARQGDPLGPSAR